MMLNNKVYWKRYNMQTVLIQRYFWEFIVKHDHKFTLNKYFRN